MTSRKPKKRCASYPERRNRNDPRLSLAVGEPSVAIDCLCRGRGAADACIEEEPCVRALLAVVCVLDEVSGPAVLADRHRQSSPMAQACLDRAAEVGSSSGPCGSAVFRTHSFTTPVERAASTTPNSHDTACGVALRCSHECIWVRSAVVAGSSGGLYGIAVRYGFSGGRNAHSCGPKLGGT